jgi:hypothetical protein
MTTEQYSPKQIAEMIISSINLYRNQKYVRGTRVDDTIRALEEYKTKVPQEIKERLERLEIINLSQLERMTKGRRLNKTNH